MKILFFSLLPIGDLSRELIGFFLDEAGIDDEHCTIWPDPDLDTTPNVKSFTFVVVMGQPAWTKITRDSVVFEHGKITKRDSRYYISVISPSELVHAGNADKFLDVAKDVRKIIEEELL